MTTDYITLKVGDTFQVGDEIYIESEGRYVMIDEQFARYHCVVPSGSVYRRPVTRSVSNSDRREWQEEEKEAGEPAPTLQEELTKANEYLQRVLKGNMDLHNEVHRLQEHHDRLKRFADELRQKLQTSEERRLRLMHTDSVAAAVPKTEVEQEETELERKAWEVFVKYRDFNVTEAFDAAYGFITERDRRRKESGK